ncbi:hypothetical protein LG296_01585 [Ureibacillus chungkukjangi]|uniref:hypothetical protein n=1 Tax=Ureibacillus chungkukjangi TaxID=1202712 RepID=UPI00384CC03F
MVEQTNLFEFLGLKNDPVFNLIEKLREGDKIQIDSFCIRNNGKLYEVESDEYHEGFPTKERCYTFVCANL